MNKNSVQKIVDENIKRYLQILQLQHWKIEIEYSRLNGDAIDGEVKGYCRADPKYRHAIIEIDPDHAESEEDVIHTLRHELLHIYHSDWQLYRRVVARLVSDREFEALDEIFNHAAENSVMQLESLLTHGLKVPLKEKE